MLTLFWVRLADGCVQSFSSKEKRSKLIEFSKSLVDGTGNATVECMGVPVSLLLPFRAFAPSKDCFRQHSLSPTSPIDLPFYRVLLVD